LLLFLPSDTFMFTFTTPSPSSFIPLLIKIKFFGIYIFIVIMMYIFCVKNKILYSLLIPPSPFSFIPLLIKINFWYWDIYSDYDVRILCKNVILNLREPLQCRSIQIPGVPPFTMKSETSSVQTSCRTSEGRPT